MKNQHNLADSVIGQALVALGQYDLRRPMP